MGLLEKTVARITPLDNDAMEAAAAHQDCLAIPAGSLGRLREFAIRSAGITGRPHPEVGPMAVVTMAGDHGVAAQGVSRFPQEVTKEMVANFLRGGAAIAAVILGMRLGEGTGAAYGLSILSSAARLSADMLTFSEAAVSGPGPAR